MKAEIKERWVAALKSGEFNQTDGFLAFSTGGCKWSYCCLGVLCEILKDEAGLEVEEISTIKIYDTNSTVLPDRIVELAELEHIDPRILGKALSKYNDEDRLPFEEIAELIEKHL